MQEQIVAALAIAMGTPLFLVIVRHEIRMARLRALYEFDELFEVSRVSTSQNDPDRLHDANAITTDPKGTPSYEYVRARYTDDIAFPNHFKQSWIKRFDMGVDEFRTFVRKLRWWKIRSSWAIMLAAAPFIALISVGFGLVFSSTTSGAPCTLDHSVFLIRPWCATTFFVGGLPSADTNAMIENESTVAAIAFVGGYLFSVLLFLRALATFDLSPLTMLRAAAYIVVGVVSAVVLYRAAQDPLDLIEQQANIGAKSISAAFGGGSTTDASCRSADSSNCKTTTRSGGRHEQTSGSVAKTATDGVRPLGIWIAFAFLIGFTPDLGADSLMALTRRYIFQIKRIDNHLTSVSKTIPLDIIDGIDPFTRFRLEEANIYDVQNLATANPILLFIETPYGIYEIIDWVAQAQLCVAVGPDRFFDLRRHAIRTIFDLERAVLSKHTTVQLRRYVGGLLLAPVAATDGNSPSQIWPLGLSLPPAIEGQAPRNADSFAEYAANLFSAPATRDDGSTVARSDQTLRHLVTIIVDDLHVCRLRQIWLLIRSKIDSQPPPENSSEKLPDSEDGG